MSTKFRWCVATNIDTPMPASAHSSAMSRQKPSLGEKSNFSLSVSYMPDSSVKCVLIPGPVLQGEAWKRIAWPPQLASDAMQPRIAAPTAHVGSGDTEKRGTIASSRFSITFLVVLEYHVRTFIRHDTYRDAMGSTKALSCNGAIISSSISGTTSMPADALSG